MTGTDASAPAAALSPAEALGLTAAQAAGLGAGVRVLVLGAAVANAPVADTHSQRVGSLCSQLAGRAQIGYATAAHLGNDTFEDDLREAVAEGGYDIVALPWSAPEQQAEQFGVRRAFEAVAGDPDGALFIAAAGHDGPGRLRFPATSPSAVAVGLGAADGTLNAWCGGDPFGDKPQLLVPDARYTAWSTDGDHPMRGTSAATGIVAGLAAALLARLRADGQVPSPQLRAALLAAAGPRGVLAHAPLVELLRGDNADRGIRQLTLPTEGAGLRITAAGHRPLRLAVTAAGPRERRTGQDAPSWMPPTPDVAVTLEPRPTGNTATSEPRRTQGAGWTVLDLPDGEEIELAVTASMGAAAHVAITGATAVVVSGAEHTEPEPTRPSAQRTSGRGPVILGISASHDASAALLDDGVPLVAIQQERLTRRKHDGVGCLDSRVTADYCLASAGLRPEEVDVFAFNAQPLLPGYVGLSVPSAAADFDLFDPFDERVVYVSHHLAHAFSAFWGSPFDEAVVAVCDGSGGSVLGTDDLLISGPELKEYLDRGLEGRLPMVHVFSAYHFDRSGYRLLFRETADSFNVRVGSSSIGETYAAVSQYVFGDWQEGSGKLMGLAPYGKADNIGASFLEPGEHGLPVFTSAWKDRFRDRRAARDPMACADLAARVQADLERAVSERMSYAMSLVPQCRDLAYAGGVALNSVANDRIARESGAERFFVLPASSDSGVSLGAAAAAHYRLTGTTRRPLGEFSDYLGHPYTQADHEAALALVGDRVQVSDLDLASVADGIAAGDVIGWFQGGSEFGPRALGHRSVFADARLRSTWDFINSQIKFREDFRPLAPIVPEEVAAEYFEIDQPSPHMLRVVPVREAYREKLAAVTHVDGTARIQTVSQASNPQVHRLLHLVGERTGIPIMVNTSLNRRGEPMIETPGQALDMLLATHLGALVLGSRVVRRLDGGSPMLTLDTCVALGPGVSLTSEQDENGVARRIRGGAEGRQGLLLPQWCFAALSGSGPGRRLGDYLPDCLEGVVVDVDDALAFLTALQARCLIVRTREAVRD
ncbi:hypothetical protein DN069_32260 [Streptacidiphilus pinicola]|uniref:Carbamoyltransferase n=1 Tax=Streptacidiphilus pinicola TaxID=2219663 RepID=A0A2X0K2I9_9ACTN|nr:carbamoyltransferase C-terminal domain-containing protein [Streptacidiphilus pinicola]RAG81530.1 hypothetical protein DN069_32260 [Streptacidiphilus pinicola]